MHFQIHIFCYSAKNTPKKGMDDTMNFREKFHDFKNRLTDRKMYSVIVGLIVIMVSVFAYQAKVSADYKTRLDAQYTRAFDDLTEYVSGIETSLSKCAAVTDEKSVVRLANDIYAKAASASTCLGQLPLSDTNLENTAKFLAQVGDFTYMLALSYMDAPVISEQQRQTMLDLSKYATTLEQGLYDTQQKLYSGAVHFGTPSSQSGEGLSGSMEQLESQFQEYPSLLYDGPFSDHVRNKEPLFLQGAPEISEKQARERLSEVLSPERMGNVSFDGIMEGRIPAYVFTVHPEGEKSDRTISVEISKKGGMLLQMLDDRSVEVQNIDIEEAKNAANRFLETFGFSSMRDSYFEIKDNIATINFAYCTGDILYYPDLVKVRVSMDSGEILGMEAAGYAACHTDRAFSSPAVSAEDARKRLSPSLSVESTGLAVIPRDSQDEAFCWEFKCKMEDKTYLVYINTETGAEEDVLMLVETEGGMLTI